MSLPLVETESELAVNISACTSEELKTVGTTRVRARHGLERKYDIMKAINVVLVATVLYWYYVHNTRKCMTLWGQA